MTVWTEGYIIPASEDPGPFYFAFGPTLNANSNGTGRVRYYIKDIYLVKPNGDKAAADKFLNYRTSYAIDCVQFEPAAEPTERP